MKISELVEELLYVKHIHGDLEVIVHDNGDPSVNINGYDGNVNRIYTYHDTEKLAVISCTS